MREISFDKCPHCDSFQIQRIYSISNDPDGIPYEENDVFGKCEDCGKQFVCDNSFKEN